MSDEKRGAPKTKNDALAPALSLLFDNFRQKDELNIGAGVYLRRDSTDFYQVIAEDELVDVVIPDQFGSAMQLMMHLQFIKYRFGTGESEPDDIDVDIGRGFQ